jgi:hypothetical protein
MGVLAQIGFGARFYLGLGAPAERRRYPECAVRAAQGYSPELLRTLPAIYLGKAGEEAGTRERVNFRCCRITVPGQPGGFFFKEFPRHHFAHDLERRIRLSRVDRAWRAAHLLPKVGLLTPRAVGTVQRPDLGGEMMEYLATEWFAGGLPFPEALGLAGSDPEARAARLREFTDLMGRCHDHGVYLRDLVKNVLVKEEGGRRSYWLTDLDSVHPIRRISRRRILFHMGQLAYYCPLTPDEARLVCDTYLGTTQGGWAARVVEALTAEQAWRVAR